ncbi:MAG TPA: HEAT repeat domain-containing protein [Candidatus Aminicenantes bacterium]|nr:HEAT repeat domain-containing protein [Candidatus Aminicenantes bacterium]
MLQTIVLFSFAYLLLLSGSLFLFILARRLLVDARERRDLRLYGEMEGELLEVLTAPDPNRAALAFARRHKPRPRVLKQLLVAYREALAGRALEPLRTIFERTIRGRCLRELRSPWLTTRLQNVRLFVDFSRPEEAAHLVNLLHDKPVVRLAALNALSGIASHDTLSVIFDLFERDPAPNFYAYSNVFNSLGQRIEPFLRMSLRRPLPPGKHALLVEMAGRLLLRGLYADIVRFALSPDKELRIRAARTLGRLAVPASRRTLLALAADPAWEVQAQAVRSLGHLRDWRAIPVLVKALFSPNWHVRYNAGHGLAAYGLVGVLQLQEVSRQKEDRFAADMAAMVLDSVVLTGGGA